MNESPVIDHTIRLLKRHYYGNIIFLAGLFLAVLLGMFPFLEAAVPVRVTVERYALIITIITIPAALKLFADRLKKIPRPSETEAALHRYKKISYLRLYMISGVTLMNIGLFTFSRNPNFMWFTVVLFIIFLFCRPSYIEAMSLTGMPEEEQKAGQEPKERSEDEETPGK